MGATTLGQISPGSVPTNSGCTLCADFLVSGALGTSSYVVPAGGGVITSWTFHALSKPGSARLMLYEPGPAAMQYTLVAETPLRDFKLGETSTTQTQVPVTGGVHIGVGVIGPDPLYNSGSMEDLLYNPDFGAKIGTPELATPIQGRRPNISVILEPDADRDGYGDETQDLCPIDPAQQLPCASGTPTPTTPTTPTGSTTPATPATKAGPLVSLVTPSRESIKSGFVTVSAMSVGGVTVSANGRVSLPSLAKAYSLGSAGKTLSAGGRTTLKLKLSKKTLHAVRGRLAHHKKVSAKVTVTARSADGATSTTTIKVPLVR
jgi:hypothetical protein